MYLYFTNLWIKARPFVARYFWTFVGYLLSQIGVQIFNFCTGFTIIRSLSKEEYAIYTIINTLGPALLILSDNGIGNGIMAIGRQFWQDNDKMGALVNTGLVLRRRLAIYSLLCIGPILIWMLYRNNTPVWTIGLLSLAVLMGVSFQMTTSVLRMVLELRQHVNTLGKVNLAVAALRLALVASFIWLFHLNAFLATIAATFSFILEASYLIYAVKPQITWHAAPDPGYRNEMLSLVKKTLPLSIYFCIQGQVSVWLISVFGNAYQVADIGAVTRLSVIFTILTSTLSIFMVPRFARTEGRRQLHAQVYQVLGILAALLVVLVTFAALFPEPFIFLLGQKYANMSGLIWFVIFGSGFGNIISILFALNMSKGWVPPAYLTIPVEFISQILVFLMLDVRKTSDVLAFAVLSGIAPAILNYVLLLRKIQKEPDLPDPVPVAAPETAIP